MTNENARKCFVAGQCGNCNINCEVFQDGECPEPEEVRLKE